MALSRTKKFLIVGGVSLTLIAIVAASLMTRTTGAVGVQIETVKRRDLLESKVSASGEIRPIELYNLTAEISGRVTDIYIKEGDLVRSGQPLIKVDPTQQLTTTQGSEAQFRAAEEDARASETQVLTARNLVTQNKAQLIAAEADLQRAKAQLTLNEIQLKRTTELSEGGVASRADFDTAKTNYDVAKAGYESQLAQVDRLRQLIRDAEIGVERAEASVKAAGQRAAAAKAGLMGAQDLLNRTVRKSPIDGVVSSLPVRVGEFAVSNLSTTPLMTIADMSQVNVEIKVDETDIANVKVGQPAKIKVDALGETEIPGEVVEVGQSAVTRSGQTIANSNTSQEAKDFKVKIRLKPSDKDRNRLRPGMSATAVITTDTRRSAIAIPLQSLVTRDASELSEQKPKDSAPAAPKGKREEVQGVFVEKDGKAEFVPVKTGITGETDIEVLSGLSESQNIITGPYRLLRTLKPGASVTKDATPDAGAGAEKKS
jgi:HlyD family secretion protein